MSVERLIWFLLIGIAAGWIASMLMKSGKGGILQYMVIGVIGALLGGWLFSLLGLGASGLLGSLIVATVGAVVLIALLRLLRKA